MQIPSRSRFFIVLALIVLAGCQSSRNGTITYHVDLANAEQHTARISVTVDNVPGATAIFNMSRSSPGRYALHEFAKNVYDVVAQNGAGDTLTMRRPDGHRWIVDGHDGTVTFSYTLFADRADGTYAQIDRSHAHLNMPASFAWPELTEDRPIEITFAPSDTTHQVITQLFPVDGDPYTFTAPNLYYFLDSPTQVSASDVRVWTVGEGEASQRIRLSVHHNGTAEDVDELTSIARRIVDQTIAIFGEAPRFDGGEYTFIAAYLPWASGDGMEHRNSTILTRSLDFSGNVDRVIGTLAHEFVHAWNVERIRPSDLEPFDFMDANMTDALWFAEGFTSYYTPLLLRRAEAISDEAYAEALTRTLNTVDLSPGRHHFSAKEMSMQAPFVDAATSNDPTSRHNTFISYYTWGAAIGAALDLTLRTSFDLSLDGYMQAMWKTHGVDEVPYEVADLESVLAEYTGDAAFAEDFFDRFIAGHEMPDMAPLLAAAGMQWEPASTTQPFVGPASWTDTPGAAGATLATYTLEATPLYTAGLTRGDVVFRANDTAITSARDLEQLLENTKPGDVVQLDVRGRGKTFKTEVQIQSDPAHIVTLDANATDAQRAFRKAWLDPQ